MLAPYSGGELVKNQTLNVWRTHDAVDIAGEKGARIFAAGDGEIVAVSNDPLWGGMVQIKHPDGYTSSYSGVDLLATLQAGQQVTAGQELGTLGDIPAEISSEPHLHFALSRAGRAVKAASTRLEGRGWASKAQSRSTRLTGVRQTWAWAKGL